MPFIQTVRWLLCILTVASLADRARTHTTGMQTFLDKISHEPESELPGILYGYKQVSPGAQRILVNMLRPLRAPAPQQHLSIEATRQMGHFTMLVVHVPWPHGPAPNDLFPIIVTGDTGNEQVVGYVLPFNDIMSMIQPPGTQDLRALSMWWITEYAQTAGQKG